MRLRPLSISVLVGAASLCAVGCADAPMGDEDPAERIGARDGVFSLIPSAGWERPDPELLTTAPARADLFLMYMGPSGRASVDATHAQLPPGMTLEQHRAEAEGAPRGSSPPVSVLVDGHEAIAWCATGFAGREAVETCAVSVLVGTRVYDFHLRSAPEGFDTARADFEQMVRSVRF